MIQVSICCLMHLDDEEKIRQMIEGTPLQIVEVD